MIGAIHMTNRTRSEILKNSLLAVAGLLLFGLGVHLTIQANIGAAPWDAFSLGLSSTFGMSFGNAAVLVSFLVVGIDLLLREKIGIGMILDAVIVGKTVDFLNWTGLIPQMHSPIAGAIFMVLGMTVSGFSQAIYMRAALGCGPRDTLLVGLSRRLDRLPIGAVSICIQATVALAGFLLGGPIGIGTLMFVLLQGPVMQFDFHLLGFDAKAVQHQDILESARIIAGK